MVCQKCLNRMRVIDTRENIENGEVYRLVRCDTCDREIYTVEYEAVDNPAFMEEWHKCRAVAQRNKRIKKTKVKASEE